MGPFGPNNGTVGNDPILGLDFFLDFKDLASSLITTGTGFENFVEICLKIVAKIL